MKILVTGGSAFIGSTISDSLSTKYKVISPTSQQLNLLNASDVKDYLNKNSFDIVIHSANHLVHPLLKESKEPSIQLVNNLKMFFNIAINKNLFGKMIYFGSGAEFGRENWKSKMKESYFGNHYPTDQYGLSKYFMNIQIWLILSPALNYLKLDLIQDMMGLYIIVLFVKIFMIVIHSMNITITIKSNQSTYFFVYNPIINAFFIIVIRRIIVTSNSNHYHLCNFILQIHFIYHIII